MYVVNAIQLTRSIQMWILLSMARLTPIRLALLQGNRTQKWLAEQIGASETVTSRVVNGLIPDDDVVEAICRVLERPASVLFPHLSAASDHTVDRRTPSSEIAA